MDYKSLIKKLSQEIPKNIVDLEVGRKRGTAPTQAFSDFLTHSEQGDWAELLFFNTLKNAGLPYIPVKYGKSDKIIAGDVKFKDFYEAYQDELDSIGKRPDILLFKPEDYQKEWGTDISNLSQSELEAIVPKAIAGFEVRSSAYLTKKFIAKKDRPFLSFTPKVEDLLVVLKWVTTFGVPHFYVQVFFDAIYIISFEEILLLLKNGEIKEKGVKNKKIIGQIDANSAFVIEKNPKNQYKETIHIYLDRGHVLSDEVEVPNLVGSRKELAGGRLLHYVVFEGGSAKIDKDELFKLIDNTF
ncbi:MAG: AccI family restriction endonuclease [Candidatus Staskawiczbacteria bacterium]|nr:AccI family restriction endonuclease [Candidatus Staskawiczbacteria bacterium]